MLQQDRRSPPESFQEHQRHCNLELLTLGWIKTLRAVVSSVLLSSHALAASSITDENTGSRFQTECCLTAGAEKKGATVQRVMAKRIPVHGY